MIDGSLTALRLENRQDCFQDFDRILIKPQVAISSRLFCFGVLVCFHGAGKPCATKYFAGERFGKGCGRLVCE